MSKLIQPRVETGNVYDDILENIKRIYEDHQSELGLMRIYNEDPELIDITPSLAQQFESEATEEPRCLGNKCQTYLARINVIIWYYFEEIVDTIAKKEAARMAWKVSEIIRIHNSLNGYLTAETAEVRSINYLVRARASGFYNASRILVEVPKRFSVTRDNDTVSPIT